VLKAEFCNDKNFVSKFKAEAQAAAGLSHPNIVSIYDVGDEDEIHYIVMELVEGITLKQYIDKKKKLDIKESIGITIQIAQGIGAAHEQHIIPRDIKPQNVIISKDGKVKVTDFGIAKAASSQTINSEAVGSVYYFSPEQARGGYCDERSDIYSLGITLYEMLTGRVPFEGESTVAVALAHLQSEMVPPRELEPMIPISLDKIILKATQKKPERRYASAAELIADLRKALLMPEEDFVKVIPVNNTSPTLLISEDEISKIKQSKSIVINDEDGDAVETTALSSKVEKPAEYEIESEEEDETEEESNTFDKVIFVLGIVVCVAILCLAAYFLTRAFKSFGNSSSQETTTETGSDETSISAKQTIMPKVKGLSYEEAVKLLKDNDLGVNPQYQSSEDVEENYVIDQEYEEGTVVDKNISVTLYVSSGSSMITLPDDEEMVGENATNVKRRLSQLGFDVKTETEYSSDYEEDTVTRVTPAGGTKLNKGDTVTVYVSLGEKIEYIYVPDLTGKTVEEAEDYLEEREIVLIIDKIEYAYGDGTKYTKDQIMAQDLEVNESVEKGSKINVTVCKGNEYVEVPSLLEKSEEEANQILDDLEDANLSVGKVTESYSDSVEKGLICSQSVTGKTKVGTKVDIVISKGKEYTKVPSLLGKTQDEAKKALQDAELELGNVTQDYSADVASGYVMKQSYSENTELKSGSKVDIVISQGVRMIQLPSALQGQNYEDMKAKLESQGFTVHGTEVERSDVIPGCIVSCNFAAGESVAYGSVIEFTVAVAPATTAAPTEATTEQAAPASEE
jgi:serine/threonine-protein kinase